MGERGPVPNRSDQRRRRNKPPEGAGITKAAAAPRPTPPEPDADWHQMATDLFLSLRASGQAEFYEASDWQMARIGCELLSRELGKTRPSAQMVASVLSLFSSLLLTEGDRRRLRLELERAKPVDDDEDAAVTALDDYRARFSS